MALRKLSELRIGTRATIHSFAQDELSIKLMEMGFIPGEQVRVDQVAPLGDPICILVSGYSLSLRLNEADKILVDDAPPGPPAGGEGLRSF